MNAPTSPTTAERYRDPSGGYNPERQARHQLLLREMFHIKQKRADPEAKPCLVVLGGVSGSGKGGAGRWLRRSKIIPENVPWLDSGKFSIFQEYVKIKTETTVRHPEKTAEMRDEYYDIRDRVLEEAIRNKRTLVIDDHMDNPERDRALVERAREAGYGTYLVGMAIPPANFFSFLSRHERSDDLKKWFLEKQQQFTKSWDSLIALFDHSFLFTNTYRSDVPVTLAAEFSRTDSGVDARILNGHRVEMFKQWETVHTSGTSVEEGFPRKPGEDDRGYDVRIGRGRTDPFPSPMEEAKPKDNWSAGGITALGRKARGTIDLGW